MRPLLKKFVHFVEPNSGYVSLKNNGCTFDISNPRNFIIKTATALIFNQKIDKSFS